VRSVKKSTSVILIAMFLTAGSAFGGVMPSKIEAGQSIADREAALATIEAVVANERVAQVLALQGLSRDDVNTRLASLSTEELSRLSENLQQVQAAGLTREQWTWIGIGALAVLLLIVLT
jgi:hypothetical protein